MNCFERNNRCSGVHWLKKPICDLQIKIQLKPCDNIILTQSQNDKTEDFHLQPELDTSVKTQDFTFKWQEKVFSKWELLQYSESYNCSTDTEFNYHNFLSNNVIQPSYVSTQINEDIYASFQLKGTKTENFIDKLCFCLEGIELNGLARSVNSETQSTRHLFRSDENIQDQGMWISMNVVLDCSDYREDQLLMRREVTLVSLHYNPDLQCLILSPDINTLEWNPYSVTVNTAVATKYEYAVKLESGQGERNEELVQLLTTIQNKWRKRNKGLLNFQMPSLGKKQTIVNMEIVSATGFDLDVDNLYIEYDIKLPEGIHCDGPLHGRTHTSKALSHHRDRSWYFAHPVELNLVADAAFDLEPIKLIMEVISTDWWDSHRTEGYCHTSIPSDPGQGSRTLTCCRPEERDQVEADTRRFFVAGFHLLEDLDVLTEPRIQEANFRFVTTGSVTIRWSSISQSHVTKVSSPPSHGGSTFSSAELLRGAEAVLRQYRKAKERLYAATSGVNEENIG